MKITKVMIVKLITATIVPGGFIIWGLHEYSKYRANTKKICTNPDKTKPS